MGFHSQTPLILCIQVTEIYNFAQDDLMTEDIYILDCHTAIFVWVGQQVDAKNILHALRIGEVRKPIGQVAVMRYFL